MEVATYIGQLILNGVLLAIVVYYIERRQKKKDDLTEKREQARLTQSLLSMKLIVSNGELTKAVAVAVKRGYPNGEIEKATEEYEAALAEYQNFIREQAVEHLK